MDGAWLQQQLDARFLTLSDFAREVPCDDSTLRKALDGQRISVRKAFDIMQAIRRLPLEACEVTAGLLGIASS